VKTPFVKKPSNWPLLDRAVDAIAQGTPLPSSVFAAIADRLRAAIESPDAARIDSAAALLEDLFRRAAAAAPLPVQAASRGEQDGDLSTGYALGKLAFAQLLAARIADTRADTRFIEHVRDPRYLPFIQALYGEPLSVGTLAESASNRIETVSRKLNILRALGIVVSRRRGTVVENMLTPAARTTLEALGLAPTREEPVPVVKEPEVQRVIADKLEALAPHLQATPLFVGRGNDFKRAA
jgi:DNA-binding transcriptional ArsR family regulator